MSARFLNQLYRPPSLRALNEPQPILQVLIKPFSVPMIFLHETEPQKLWACGGTGLLWQSREGRFVVSSAHVWRELVKQRDARQGRMSICVGMGQRVVSLLEAEPAAIDDELDIVVLTAPPEIDQRMGNKLFYHTDAWPPVPAMGGETLGVLGFPGELRQSNGFTIETNSFYYENTCAVSLRGTSIMIGAFSDERPVTVVHVDHAVEPLKSFGGISGAPVFALRHGRPVWVGVVKRGAEGLGSEAGIQASPSHFVQTDGSIITP